MKPVKQNTINKNNNFNLKPPGKGNFLDNNSRSEGSADEYLHRDQDENSEKNYYNDVPSDEN